MAQSHPNGVDCADEDIPVLWWVSSLNETWTVCSGCQYVYAIVPGRPLRHPLELVYR